MKGSRGELSASFYDRYLDSVVVYEGSVVLDVSH